MKNLPTFDQFLIEGFVKAYGDKMNPEEFKAIEIGSEVLYAGNRYKVEKNDGITITLKSVKSGGSGMKVNLGMFIRAGAITESVSLLEATFDGKRVCIFPGRFQPFHNGHIAALKKASEVLAVPVVPIQILSKTDKSPFPDALLEKMGKAVAKEFPFIAEYFLYPSNLKTVVPQMVKYLREQGYESIGMGSGSDRIKSYEPQIKYLNSEKSDVPVSEPFRLEMVDERGIGGPSGTKVREAIQNDDEATFKKMTPKSIHPFYKELKKYIL
jgi:phosphopantetheine adenylyltransferase